MQGLPSQQALVRDPILFKYWPTAYGTGPTLKQHWVKSSCLLGLTAGRDMQGTILSYKWNESGFRLPLSTYRLNWARRTSWVWWDDWDDTVLQTQDSKFEPWRSEVEHATSRSQYWLSHVDGEQTFFVSFKSPRPGTEPRTLAWKAAVLTTTLGPPPSVIQSQTVVATYFSSRQLLLCYFCSPSCKAKQS